MQAPPVVALFEAVKTEDLAEFQIIRTKPNTDYKARV